MRPAVAALILTTYVFGLFEEPLFRAFHWFSHELTATHSHHHHEEGFNHGHHLEHGSADHDHTVLNFMKALLDGPDHSQTLPQERQIDKFWKFAEMPPSMDLLCMAEDGRCWKHLEITAIHSNPILSPEAPPPKCQV